MGEGEAQEFVWQKQSWPLAFLGESPRHLHVHQGLCITRLYSILQSTSSPLGCFTTNSALSLLWPSPAPSPRALQTSCLQKSDSRLVCCGPTRALQPVSYWALPAQVALPTSVIPELSWVCPASLHTSSSATCQYRKQSWNMGTFHKALTLCRPNVLWFSNLSFQSPSLPCAYKPTYCQNNRPIPPRIWS